MSTDLPIHDQPHAGATEEPSDGDVIELYSPDFAYVYSVPHTAIYQMPPPRMHITRFCACKNFSNAVLKAVESGNSEMGTEAWYKTACPMVGFCRFVHVARPLSEFPRQAIHVHYIWRSLKDVTYEALEPTLTTGDEPPSSPRLRLILSHDYRNQILKMREQCDPEDVSSPKVLIRDGDVDFHTRTDPNAAVMIGVMAAVLPTVRVPATRLLKTAGAAECLRRSQAGETVPELALCLTYLIENECRLGCECPYAHAINLDSSLNVPFIRRTLKQIKKAAIAMELVASDNVSTAPMSAGTSCLNTPSLTPRMLSSHQFSYIDNDSCPSTTPRTVFDSDLVVDQLSLSFDSFVSNSVSEFSVVNNNNIQQQYQQLTHHQAPAAEGVGSDAWEEGIGNAHQHGLDLNPTPSVVSPPIPSSNYYYLHQQHFQQQVRGSVSSSLPPPYGGVSSIHDRGPMCMGNSVDGLWSGSVSLPLSSSADSMGSNGLQFPPQWAASHAQHTQQHQRLQHPHSYNSATEQQQQQPRMW